MSDNNTTVDKNAAGLAGKTLSLKRPSVEQNVVRQSFSHGRSKSVVVETVKRRPGVAPSATPSASASPQPQREAPTATSAAPQQARSAQAPQRSQQAQRPASTSAVGRTLTDGERSARDNALVEARRYEEERRRIAEVEAKARQERDEAARREREAAEARNREEAARAKQAAEPEAPSRQKLEQEAAALVASLPPAKPQAVAPVAAAAPAAPRPAAPAATPATARPAYAPRSDQPRTDNRSSDNRGGENRGPRSAEPRGEYRPSGDRREHAAPRPNYDGRPQRLDAPRPPRLDGAAPASGPGDPNRAGRPNRDMQGRPAFGAGAPRRDGDARPPRRDGDAAAGGTSRFGFAPKPGEARPPRPAGAPTGARPGGMGMRGAPPAPSAPEVTTLTRQAPPSAGKTRVYDEDSDAAKGVRKSTKAAIAPKPEKAKVGDAKRRGKLTVSNSFQEDDERTRSVAAFRRRVQKMKGGGANDRPEKITREVIIPDVITIQELANRMTERGVDVIRLLMKQGQMHKITDVIDADTAQLVAEEMGHSVKRVSEADVEEGLFDVVDSETDSTPRPPVVTIMGHVDHGKTSLLDAIRQTNVVSGEAGGITQHIGAYQVTSPLGGKITFIDTPGHAAFTAMRARGAKVTDIVVLVVAADDGVMPQTIEAISHAKAAKVPLIVAINKIDKPDANAERVRTELLQYEVQVESFGGDTMDVEVSAKQRLNLDKLLEVIQLQSEVLQLTASKDRPAEGTVVEAKLDKGRGPVATVLVQRGTLRHGDIVVAGSEWGRVRALLDDHGKQIQEAAPSVPVEILGFNGAPEAGDRVAVVENEARAREISDYRLRQKRDKAAARGTSQGRNLSDMMTQLKQSSGRKELPLVIKGDVQGSVEAIVASLLKIGTDEVSVRILHSGVGGITESDVTLAQAAGASIIGFNVRAHKEGREASERTGTEIRYYNIIYDLVDDIKAAMSGMLAPTLRENFLGNAEVLEVFNITKVGTVAGCRVTEGKVERGAQVRLIRDTVVIHEGTLSTLKRFKDEVKEVQTGQECGMAFEKYEDLKKGDIIECYRVESIKRSL